jgi:alkylation response protein AidB-like acyl-CoA dehydrogenase
MCARWPPVRLGPPGDESPAGPLERARLLAGLIEASADGGERERRPPGSVLEALLDAALFRLLLPRTLGGGEVDPATFVRALEALSQADASPAWCLGQAAGCPMVAAHLRPDVAREILGDPLALLAWGPGPEARATLVEGGNRVSGTWSFRSGCRHATWLGGLCTLQQARARRSAGRTAPSGAAGCSSPPPPRPCWTRGTSSASGRREATTADASRFPSPSIGLRATGSDSFTVSDLFAPEEHSVARDDPAERRQGGPLHCFTTTGARARQDLPLSGRG